jgi:hypothetical protein
VQQTGIRTWLILYHELNAPCSAFSAVGLRCGEASLSVRDAAVCIQFNRWRHLEWVMTEAAPTPLTVESAKCQRRDLGPYLWTELLPFPYYALPIGCRFAWVSGCLVPDPDHPAPVTPVAPTPIPRQPPPPREAGEGDEAYVVRVARQELVRAVGPTAIARGHVEVHEQEEGENDRTAMIRCWMLALARPIPESSWSTFCANGFGRSWRSPIQAATISARTVSGSACTEAQKRR